MKKFRSAIAAVSVMISFVAYASEGVSRRPADHDLAASFAALDLKSAKQQAEMILEQNPNDALALFVRMEAAEIEAQPDVALDSALRLCNANLPEDVLRIASGRILKYAANSRPFHAVLERIEAAARRQNTCAANLRLALVSAAADGDSAMDLDQASASAGVLTRWRVAGPFGHYSNTDFDHRWPPENDGFARTSYGALQSEEFWFRDGIFNLPDYFSSSGIYYATSEIETSGAQDSVLEIFSSGPYAAFVDGKLLFTHDSRYAISSSSDSAHLELSAGKHRVTVKLNTDAAPFRVVIHAAARTTPARTAFDAGPLESYIAGMAAYLRDDLPSVERITSSDSSRAAAYLRALLSSAIDEHSAEARTAWEALLPAPLARIKIAEISADSSDDPSDQEIGKQLPQSEAAQEAAFEISRREDPVLRLIELHPSCSHLLQALRFFAGEPQEQQKLTQQLPNCAPESLDYAKALSAEGRHKDAAAQLTKVLAVNPLNRKARKLLIRELLLDGRADEAAEQARRLHEIAPNSDDYARIATSPDTALDSTSGRVEKFVESHQFYVPYRRSGLEIIRDSANRHFSGGPSVTLLSDKMAEIRNDGSLSVYTHRVTRLLNKDGIAALGEVLIPRGADLLELRTIKTNPTSIIEPELAQQKSTVSMPALEPGDSIEEEFVQHYGDWNDVPKEATEFTFGSFAAPILESRFVVIAPEGLPVEIAQKNGAADPHVEHSSDGMILIWEQKNISQTTQESALPLENQLPYVAVMPVSDENAQLRDEMISATRIGMEVTRVARTLQQAAPGSDSEKARQLFRFVAHRIQPANADWSANSAEDSLLNFEGSRTAALLGLAHAMGLNADLILARRIGEACGENDLRCYSVPLVRFTFASGNALDTDAESGGVFGAIPPGVDTGKALRLSVRTESQKQDYVALKPQAENEKSAAEAELFLDESRNLTVDLHIRLGATRGQQVRGVLQAANQRDRQMFFDQLAVRIFPGATQVTGSSLHLDDREQSLELALHFQVPQFVHSGSPWAVDEMVPSLGLTDLFVRTVTRKFPLYLDSVLFESATFHLHLSPGLQLRSLPAHFKTQNQFGTYSVEFTGGGQDVTVHREFQIPVQIISPQRYPQFVQFARQIDDAERGKIGLSGSGGVAGGSR